MHQFLVTCHIQILEKRFSLALEKERERDLHKLQNVCFMYHGLKFVKVAGIYLQGINARISWISIGPVD